MTPAGLRRWAAGAGLSAARQSRLLRYVYRGEGTGRSDRDGLADELRQSLSASFAWPALPQPAIAQGADGTRKLVFALASGGAVETVLIPGDDARDLAELLCGMRAKVNLIPFNPHRGAPYERPDDASVRRFQTRLLGSGLCATVRATRGDSVSAACGQLAASMAS